MSGITNLGIDKFFEMKKIKILKKIIWEFTQLTQSQDI